MIQRKERKERKLSHEINIQGLFFLGHLCPHQGNERGKYSPQPPTARTFLPMMLTHTKGVFKCLLLNQTIDLSFISFLFLLLHNVIGFWKIWHLMGCDLVILKTHQSKVIIFFEFSEFEIA